MKKITNYKIQITNKLQITMSKITNIRGVLLVNETGAPSLPGIPSYNIRNYKQKIKGGHSLHKDSSRLQTMTAFNEKLLRGVQGGGFLEKSPPGKKKVRNG